MPPQDDAPLSLGAHLQELRVRSYEAEMLISGLLVFALVDFIPGALEATRLSQMFRTESPTIDLAASAAFSCAWIAVTVLKYCFVLHLGLRGYWIALIGLSSVFPKGFRLDRLRWSALYERDLGRKYGSIDTFIDRLDHVGSALFAFSVMAGLVFAGGLAYTVFTAILFQGFVAVIQWTDGERHLLSGMVALASLALGGAWLTVSAVWLLDVVLGGPIKRISWMPFAWPYFQLDRLLSWVTLVAVYRPFLLTIQSHPGTSRYLVAGVVGVGAVLAWEDGWFSQDDEDYVPGCLVTGACMSGDVMVARYYEDQRPAEKSSDFVGWSPFIPSSVIEGRLLRVFIPYNVMRNDVLRALCPEVQPFRSGIIGALSTRESGDARAYEAVDCLLRRHHVIIDETPVQDAAWFLYRHPVYEETGLLGMIDVTGLRPGRHVLFVDERASVDPDEERQWERSVIPFFYLPD